jgi:hypothetical protein
MRGEKLLLYLAVLLLVAGGYFYSESRYSRQAAQEKAAKQVFKVKVSDINALTLKSDKGEIQLQRVAATEKLPAPSTSATPVPSPQAGEWQITKPIAVKADELTINSLLSALTELKLQRHLDEVSSDKLKEFGLEKPIFTLEFQIADQTHQLHFGHKVPGDQNIYAQKDTDPRVLLIRFTDKETLARTLTDLRTKKIFTFTPEQVTEIRLIRNQDRLTLQKTEASEWTPGEQLKAKLRTDKINALLGQISGAKALEFVAEKADDLKKYGLVPSPTLRLTLMNGKQEETLLLGNKQGERYYAQISGTSPIIQVDKSLLENLPASYEALEDRRLWAGQDAEVQKVIWGTPDKQITAVRDKNGWNIQMPDKPPHRESTMKFSLALWRLKDMEYSRLQNSVDNKNSAPVFTLQLLGPEDKRLFRLEEFAGEKDQIKVIFSQGEKTLTTLIPAKALAQLKETLEGLTASAPKNQEKSPATK